MKINSLNDSGDYVPLCNSEDFYNLFAKDKKWFDISKRVKQRIHDEVMSPLAKIDNIFIIKNLNNKYFDNNPYLASDTITNTSIYCVVQDLINVAKRPQHLDKIFIYTISENFQLPSKFRYFQIYFKIVDPAIARKIFISKFLHENK